MSARTPSLNQPFRSLTVDNPLCSLPNGGLTDFLSQIQSQANWFFKLIRGASDALQLTDQHREHYITVGMNGEVLFSENHNILANMGYRVRIYNGKITIAWKCPGEETCVNCQNASQIPILTTLPQPK